MPDIVKTNKKSHEFFKSASEAGYYDSNHENMVKTSCTNNGISDRQLHCF